MAAYKSNPKFQLVQVRLPSLAPFKRPPLISSLAQINLQDNVLKAYLVSLFMSSLRGSIPEQHHATYLLSTQNLELQREAMGIHNKHVGYTYLVAPDGKIRWAGSAFAEKAEQDALVACAGVLLNRLKENASK